MASEPDGFRERAKWAEECSELDHQTVTGMANSERAEILVVLSERSASKKGLSRSLVIDYDRVKYEVNKLLEIKVIEVDYEVRVGPTVEVFYRAVERPHIKMPEWRSVPPTLHGNLRASLLDKINKDSVAAVEEGTYDDLANAHMSRTPGLVDEEGEEELAFWLTHALEGVIAIYETNRKRIAKKNAVGKAVNVTILGYASTTPGGTTGPPPDVSEVPPKPEGDEGDASANSQPNAKEKAKKKRKKS
jgi:dsDNA-binding SOS-regulon protein